MSYGFNKEPTKEEIDQLEKEFEAVGRYTTLDYGPCLTGVYMVQLIQLARLGLWARDHGITPMYYFTSVAKTSAEKGLGLSNMLDALEKLPKESLEVIGAKLGAVL